MPEHPNHVQNHGAPPPASTPAQGLWHGDGLIARSVRFTLTLMAPMAVGFAVGADVWIAYALLTCILGFTLDSGGAAFERLGAFAVAALAVLVGGVLGTFVRGDAALTTLVLGGTAMIYGLVEGVHPSAASSARFLCLTAAIAALYAPLQIIDLAVVPAFTLYAWLVSVAWDGLAGGQRPSTAPESRKIATFLRDIGGSRWLFAAIVGLAVAGAFLAARRLGLEHPNWTILALVVVLHADAKVSWRLVVNLFGGTVLGVAAASAYSDIFVSPVALMTGMTLAALIRWPAQKRHGALGLGAMAVFVVLLLQLVGVLMGEPSHAPIDRLLDISLGCGFSIAALWVNAGAQNLLTRWAPNAR